MTQQEVIEAIKALAEVVKANTGNIMDMQATREVANKKLEELIPLLNAEDEITHKPVDFNTAMQNIKDELSAMQKKAKLDRQ